MQNKSAITFLRELDTALTALQNSDRAAAMAAYMKNQFPFLGVATPARRAAVKTIPKVNVDDLPFIVRSLWRRKQREYQYVAIDLLASNAKIIEPAATLALLEELALKKSWWDCVDGLAGVGSTLLLQHNEARAVVNTWSAHESFWVNRLAILHQNGWGLKTDQKLLFNLCLEHASNEEFFIRKAIGWALRDYAWKNPVAVNTFVESNRHILSALSTREALKNIERINQRSLAIHKNR
jgi:3-methyladenine DNA glycosylase AlkD